jgi:hypothetical protein
MFCRLDPLHPHAQLHQQQEALQQLHLWQEGEIAVFGEAVQQATEQLHLPIAWVGVPRQGQLLFKATVGLHHLLGYETLRSQPLPYTESYGQYVIDAQQPLVISETTADPVWATSVLCQHYGVRAYCGIPLVTVKGICIGVLAVLSPHPQAFDPIAVDLLRLIGQGAIAAYERDQALAVTPPVVINGARPAAVELATHPTDRLMIQLLQELTYELRTPLTSIIGMTRVLEQQVYGNLTDKQKKYLAIVRQSGDQVLTSVEEMLNLSHLIESGIQLKLTATDVEMLAQQVLQQLHHINEQRNHTLHISVEPGHRLWSLDKEKITAALYYLLYSMLHITSEGAQIHLHIAWRGEPHESASELQVSLWINHPAIADQLGDHSFDLQAVQQQIPSSLQPWLDRYPIVTTALCALQSQPQGPDSLKIRLREVCGLLICCELLSLHQGRLVLQNSPQVGYRYIVKVPALDTADTIASAPDAS